MADASLNARANDGLMGLKVLEILSKIQTTLIISIILVHSLIKILESYATRVTDGV